MALNRLRRFVPISGPALTWWAWRNRREISNWATFARNTLRGILSGEPLGDALTEARLRGALAFDQRTRGIPGLSVRVRNGEATIAGTVSPEVRAAAVRAAERTKGVRSVLDLTRERASGGRWFRRGQRTRG